MTSSINEYNGDLEVKGQIFNTLFLKTASNSEKLTSDSVSKQQNTFQN